MITDGVWVELVLSQKCMLRYFHIRFETLSRAQKVHIRWGELLRASLKSLTNHQHTWGGETLVEELGMYFTASRQSGLWWPDLEAVLERNCSSHKN